MPGHQMNMSMLYRLIRLCSAVHHNAETLRLPFLDQQFSQFADEFNASGIFNRRQVEDGWGMIAANSTVRKMALKIPLIQCRARG